MLFYGRVKPFDCAVAIFCIIFIFVKKYISYEVNGSGL